MLGRVSPTELLRLPLALAVLLAVATAVLRAAGVRTGAAPVIAVLRGGLQLTAIALVLTSVLQQARPCPRRCCWSCSPPRFGPPRAASRTSKDAAPQ